MIINHNMSAINANRVLKFKHWDVNSSMEKLSSGMRINRSGDDASGLAVSEKMRTQIMGLRQAERNTEDGMSFVQTTEGYLDQTSSILQRIRVLAVQSSNGIYTQEDRQLIQVEVSALIDEIDRIASQAEFNKFKLLLGEFSRTNPKASMWFHMGPNMHQRERVYIGTMTSMGLNLKEKTGKFLANLSTADNSNRTIGIVDDALQKIAKQRADLGAYYNRMEYASKGLMNAYENIQASESRIRDADMAETLVNFTKDQILVQSGTAMLAQANMKTRTVLQLLGG
ncbi:MAG TPA: flagellin [Spirochaetota bacterium]|nr:flagellin [Spirochaetota bacterium]OPZ39247.1 MAG: Flagellar filament 35 kDa core protein [Spirochaetes bacterium ADurb.BinA120]HNU91267.1 flagellin [Spirochaetota bacterium]HPI13793.1 flagellin [Spirochaetota bacterium]HPV97808.1 flagellin [Spirochaetota bacterium]